MHNIKEILSKRLKDPELIDGAVKLFEELHFQRYAPAGNASKEQGSLLSAVRDLIGRLDKAGL